MHPRYIDSGVQGVSHPYCGTRLLVFYFGPSYFGLATTQIYIRRPDAWKGVDYARNLC